MKKNNKANHLKNKMFDLIKTKKVLHGTPLLPKEIEHNQESKICIYSYDEYVSNKTPDANEAQLGDIIKNTNKNHWINLDIINKNSVEYIAKLLHFHPLITEDILSVHQRPKIDEIDNTISVIMQMLYFNEQSESIENEQVSFELKNHVLVSFQDDANRDLFNHIRERMENNQSKMKHKGLDYMLYLLIDAIVDHYFIVLDHLGTLIEKLEEKISNEEQLPVVMNKINTLRKELIFFRRHTLPVRELINTIIKSENENIHEYTKNYFKDVSDNILLIIDLSENYRDVLNNTRDLFMSQSNMKMNEAMKFLAIVTTLLAPATVIGGIFGMNFDRIPYLHHQNGFWIATIMMITIPIFMLIYFKKKGWF
ncbi:MAG: magnesium/cobalt transporter CorA [Chitinophagaceae bacterium]